MGKKMEIPRCAEKLTSEITEGISELGRIWKESEYNPGFSPDVLKKWDDLLREWENNVELPLIIRKSGGFRGQEMKHDTGRAIIISDNSVAQWVCFNVLQGRTYNMNEIGDLLNNDNIPISFAIRAKEKPLIKYKCTLRKYSINKYGWKLCHINNVGIGRNQAINEINIEELKEKFNLLMNPNNFFIVPKVIGGLGELEGFINQQR